MKTFKEAGRWMVKEAEGSPKNPQANASAKRLRAVLKSLGYRRAPEFEDLSPEEMDIASTVLESNPEFAGMSASVRPFLDFAKRTKLDLADKLILKIVLGAIKYLSRTNLPTAEIGSAKDVPALVRLANTTPPHTLQTQFGIVGGTAKDYYRDLEDSLFLLKRNNNQWDVMDMDDGSRKFVVNNFGRGIEITDNGVNSVTLDQFLDQVSDGIEDGLRYFGVIT